MCELDCEEGWAMKNWWFWTALLEKTLESPLDCKEIQPVHSEGDQPWDFFGGNDAKAETPVLWPPHEKSWLPGKDCDAGRDWGQEEKGTTVGWMASPTRWMEVWVNSSVWWWTGRPDMPWFMGSQRVGHDWATELIWTELKQLTLSLHSTFILQRNLSFFPKWLFPILFGNETLIYILGKTDWPENIIIMERKTGVTDDSRKMWI